MNTPETERASTVTPSADFSFRQRLLGWLLIALLAITLVRPLSSTEFWWQSARGAALLNGNICPSRVLLANETANDADWLGGLLPLTAWELGGGWGVSLYPAAMLLACLAVFHFATRSHATEAAIVLGCLLSIFSYSWMQPIPQSLELGLFLLLFFAVTQPAEPPAVSRQQLFFILLLWANIGAHVLIGFAFANLFVLFGSWSRNDKLATCLLLTFAVSLTPRGVFTLWDSLHAVSPWLFSSNANLLLLPDWTNDTSAEPLVAFAFAILAAISVVLGLRSKYSLPEYLASLLLISLSTANTQLIGISAIGIGFLVCRSLQSLPSRTQLSFAIASLVCVFTYHTVSETPFGVVGLDPKLDQRLLQDGLPEVIESEVAWCDSTLAGGLYCYLTGTGRCWDVPIRANICGRSQENALFRRDLLRDRESRYRRPDGSWGGWWVTAKNRHIEVLLVEAGDTKLHEALQATEWKPTDLDASVIPYVKASNIAHQPELIRCLELQDIVSFTDWSFDVPQFSATQPYFAFLPGKGVGLAKTAALRQARLFNSLGLPVASLKVLFALRSTFGSAEYEADVRLSHRDLAFREWSEAGLNSEFHQWIGREEILTDGRQSGKTVGMGDEFESAYLAGDLQRLLQRSPTSAEEQFALAIIALEAGNVAEAIRFWEAAIQMENDNPTIVRLSRHWLDLFDAGPEE